jgi:hypothetical protein
MPLARYFLFVGGVLLALLFISDAYLPKSPDAVRADADLPVIRIHSDQKWPQSVVFDTSYPAVAPVQVAKTEASVPAPATVADVSAKVRVREAFAQLPLPDSKQSSDARKPEPKLRPKRKIARRHVAPPMVVVAQHPQFGQPQFGFFANNTW